ncbi:MAG: HD domain-containing protein [Elusimicrobiota bacterium]
MDDLNKAIELAARAHSGQVDKSGGPYILHPLRVMLRLSDPIARIVGVLHDVIEDTKLTALDVEDAGFGPQVMAALKLVTHSDLTQPYLEYVRRIRDSGDDVAIQVKMADLMDNMDPDRVARLKPDERERLQERHLAAFKLLRERLPGRLVKMREESSAHEPF